MLKNSEKGKKLIEQLKKLKKAKLITNYILKRKIYTKRNINFLLRSSFIVSIVFTSVAITSQFTKNNAKAVYINDKPVGIVDSFVTENDLYSDIVSKLNNETGTNTAINEEIHLIPVIAMSSDISSKYEISAKVKDDISYSVSACSICVNGGNKIYLKSRADAEKLLDNIKKNSVSNLKGELVSVEFTDDIQLNDEYTASENIINYTEAKKRLSTKKSDNTPYLSTKAVLKISHTKEIPYTSEEVKTDKEDKSYKKVLVEGKNGTKTITDEVTYINGKETERKTLQEAVKTKPVNEKIEIGTLEVPPTKATGNFSKPVSGVLTSGFGARWGTVHKGLDFGAPAGTPVHAADGGVVIFAGWNNGGYGNLVKISHENGYVTYYAHNSSVAVSEGDRVYKGQVVSYVGSTGDSTGNHLHFEIREDGVARDPAPFLQN